MALFEPLTVCRSDGQLEIVTKSGETELNQPTPAQLDDTPDAEGYIDCYKRLDVTGVKAMDWRRKLGGMLIYVLGGKDCAGRDFILSELPDGFVLWEHLKYKSDKVADDKKREKGKHGAVVLERQDAYLYGHPQGRKKRYRSPADFFPHVLWLATDKDGDNINCSCKMCSPDGDEETVDETAKNKMVKIEGPPKKEAKGVSVPLNAQQATSLHPTLQQMSQQAPKSTSQHPSQNISRQVSQTSVTTAAGSKEQKLDAQPNSLYLYRPGELVWFAKGKAWGLAVISKRQIVNAKPRYLLQPLSHPLHHPQYQFKDQESIRPWLAWSIPATTHARISNLSFEQVPWEQVIRGDFGSGDAEVDGSILAAKVIDASYSLYDRIESPLIGPTEVHYNGMFLGAEKIWVGDPVRLRIPGDDVVVLVVQKLIERTTPPSTSIVTFVGDIYRFVEMPTPYKNRSEWPTPALPARMVADLTFRNEVADAAKRGVWCEWRLLEVAARRGISDIKGRWYETQTLLPMLRESQQYQHDISIGITSDTGLWMNGRGDSSVGHGQRKKNRRDTLGMAVPADFKVSRGLDGLPADDLFPDELQHQTVAHPGFIDGELDQFMDLDHADAGQISFYSEAMQH